MIHWDSDSYLLATGLPLKAIGQLLSDSPSEAVLCDRLATHGKKYLERYNTFRTYFELVSRGIQKLPIIFLIVGIPGVGKSTIAKELSTAFNINIVLGGDALRSALRSHIPRKGNEVFFTSLYDTWRVFGDKSKDTIFRGFDAQSKYMNTTIQRIIADRGLRDGESLVLEYIHFLPHQFDPALLQYPSVIPIVLRINDKAEYTKRLKNRSNYTHLRSPGKRLVKHIEQYLAIQDIICRESKKYKIAMLDIDDIPTGFDAILSYAKQRIDKLNVLKDYNEPIPLLEQLEADRKEI